uniref:Uncharacterized protein n=1 Tax=Arundo donax TaxID=35708 RepID=A0A0A9EEP9_ARUDO
MCVGFNRRGSLDVVVMTSGAVAYYYRLMQVCQAEYFRQLLKPVT